jgi:hypothetical protein
MSIPWVSLDFRQSCTQAATAKAARKDNRLVAAVLYRSMTKRKLETAAILVQPMKRLTKKAFFRSGDFVSSRWP